jgi:hypothetical protein
MKSEASRVEGTFDVFEVTPPDCSLAFAANLPFQGRD